MTRIAARQADGSHHDAGLPPPLVLDLNAAWRAIQRRVCAFTIPPLPKHADAALTLKAKLEASLAVQAQTSALVGYTGHGLHPKDNLLSGRSTGVPLFGLMSGRSPGMVDIMDYRELDIVFALVERSARRADFSRAVARPTCTVQVCIWCHSYSIPDSLRQACFDESALAMALACQTEQTSSVWQCAPGRGRQLHCQCSRSSGRHIATHKALHSL
jgi:hypothetical protein